MTSSYDNARLGVRLFLAGETMFFAGLVAAYIAFRFGALEWPAVDWRTPVALGFPALAGLGFARLAVRRFGHRSYRAGRMWLISALVTDMAFTAAIPGPWQMIGTESAQDAGDPRYAAGEMLWEAVRFHALIGALWLASLTAHTWKNEDTERSIFLGELLVTYRMFVAGLWLAVTLLLYV
ncbi:MAG: hypothetical protein FJY97_15375 [candidate division Zixibacteria bacterium]|nr:hypothetical protein [candidate division Zixibacteria bacterium]